MLSIVWDFNPVFFRIGDFDIRYYGLMWALAILVGAKLFDNFCKREGLPSKVSESIFIYGTLATIIGARLGHCLFYDTMEYLSRPWTIITGFRDGGMASHGAAIGLLIGLWLFSRKNKLPYIWSLDRIMIAVGIGGAIVRMGNLFNSEIFGTATTLPWGFEFVRSVKWVNEFAPRRSIPPRFTRRSATWPPLRCWHGSTTGVIWCVAVPGCSSVSVCSASSSRASSSNSSRPSRSPSRWAGRSIWDSGSASPSSCWAST